MTKVIKKILSVFLVAVLAIGLFALVVYRDMVFRDRGDIDSTRAVNSEYSENTISILFVGNSMIFSGKIPKQLKVLAGANGLEISYRDISGNGAPLSRQKDEALSEIQTGIYDYVVIQEQSRRQMNDTEGSLRDIRVLCDAAKDNGATPVIYSPAWAHDSGRPDEVRLGVTTELNKRAAEENGAILINAADAFIDIHGQMPEVSLYRTIDNVHKNDAGAFLTTCLFAAELFALKIEDIPWNNRYSGRHAEALAQAAWEFVN